MRYILITLIFIPHILFGQNKPKNETCRCSVILFEKQRKVPISNNNGEVICYIMNDTITEDYFGISIMKIKNNRAYVSASATLYDTLPKIGWIQTKYLGIYPNKFSKINLYSKPDTKSLVRSTIIKPEYYPFNILDCKGAWLYVSYYDVDRKKKDGWLAPDDQCSNPYSTCN